MHKNNIALHPALLPLPLPGEEHCILPCGLKFDPGSHTDESNKTKNFPLLGQALSCAYVSGAREFPARLSQCQLLFCCAARPTQGAAYLLSFPKKDHPLSRTSGCLRGNLSLAGVYKGYLPVCTANICPDPKIIQVNRKASLDFYRLWLSLPWRARNCRAKNRVTQMTQLSPPTPSSSPTCSSRSQLCSHRKMFTSWSY